MEEDRKNHIEHWAEELAEEYFRNSAVNPYAIAEDYDIDVVYENYANAFKGLIWKPNDNFFIHLNSKKLGSPYFDDGRLTCSHELGHYFIPEHYNYLTTGQSISFCGNKSFSNNDPLEEEANFFGASLLLPAGHFKKTASMFNDGFDSIFSLKKIFKASVTCTAIRYVTMGLAPSILIQTEKDGKLRSWVSPTFGMKDPAVSINPYRKTTAREKKIHSTTNIKYWSAFSLLKNWVPNTNTPDKVVYEETFQPFTTSWALRLITLR